MKYQTEYQRNFQRRAVQKIDDRPSPVKRRADVPIKRSSSLSPSRTRAQSSILSSHRKDSNFAVIGPNEKFSSSHLYRLRQPVEDRAPLSKSKEFAILGRNEKFHDNVVYPLRKPIVDQHSTIPRRRQKSENHSCGIQTELDKAPSVSFDPRHGREIIPVRSRLGPQSEYQQQFNWKQSVVDPTSDQMLVEEAKVRDRRSDPALPLSVIDPSEKILAEKRPAPIQSAAPVIEFEGKRSQPLAPAPIVRPSTTNANPTKNQRFTEYQARYQPIPDQKKPRTRKAFEAEMVEERKRKEIENAERAHTDDEANTEAVPLDKEFNRKHHHANLRRWKSEYQTTYKPFWRFDYKNGKWYKDPEAEQFGFNPNLFWFKELKETREKANEYRANALADHFNRDHMLQLQTGQGGAKNFLAWDTNDNEDDTISVQSVERNSQHELRTKRWNDDSIQSRLHYTREKQEDKSVPAKVAQSAQTNDPPSRVIYLDDAQTRNPSAATQALVRNLNSSSVQQHMIWDTQSQNSDRPESDADVREAAPPSRTYSRKTEPHDASIESVRKSFEPQSETNDRLFSSAIAVERPLTSYGHSAQNKERTTQSNGFEARHAAGRTTYDTHVLDRRVPLRPLSSTGNFRPQSEDNRYGGESSLRRDSVDDVDIEPRTPVSRSSFQNHLNSLDQRFERISSARNQDDDVLSVASSRSLSSSCSLALQTHELARQNLNKFWGKK